MYDDEIEKAVLFYMIFKNCEFEVTESDFFNKANQLIAKAVNQLKSKDNEISIIAIADRINGNRTKIFEYLSELGNNIFGISSQNAYNKLIEYSKKRQVLEELKKIEGEIIEAEGIDVVIEKEIKKLNEIQRRNQKNISFSEQVIMSMEELEKNYNNKSDYSLYTGILNLDRIILGLHRKEFTVIGGRPGFGKTTFALQIATHVAEKGLHVAFMSLEMAETQIIQKIISNKSRVNSQNMRSGRLNEEDFMKITESCSNISELPLHLVTRIRTIQELEVLARQYKNNNEMDLLIIDYIQLLKNKNRFNSREQEVADISRTLKLLSLELDIPIIGLCQLNRNATRNEPTLADLRESGAIEQDADNVIFLYPDEGQEEASAPLVIAKVAKQRAGELGKALLKFKKMNSEFISIIQK